MILLVSLSSRARECAAALERATGHKLTLVSTVPHAAAKLEEAEFEAIVIDQFVVESDPRAADTLLNRCGMALPVYINLALHGIERIVREVQVALRRAEGEKSLARRSVEALLSHQLRNELTGILLNSDLALRENSIPPEVAVRVRSVRELAEKMRDQLSAA